MRDGGFQPYAAREPGPALDAMQGGKPFFLPNPQDTTRAFQRTNRRTQIQAAVERAMAQPIPPELFR